MKETDLSYTVDANGYMLSYKGKPIGGAGVKLPRTTPFRGKQRINDLRMFTDDAKREIAKLVAGRGQQRFLDVIAKIDAETGLITADLLRDDETRNGTLQMLADAANAHKSGVRFTDEATEYEREASARLGHKQA